jgi:peptidoglycan/LPS O-acetylase OafA/YrhL
MGSACQNRVVGWDCNVVSAFRLSCPDLVKLFEIGFVWFAMSRQRHRHPLGPPVSLPGVIWGFFYEPLRRSAPQRGGTYRPEIDGLRALAVLAVIANHLNQAVAREGFLGVDIFFVISGYVVTSSLLARQVASPLSFLSGFYARRFKRLLPALIAMVVLVALLFCLYVAPGEDLFLPSMRTGVTSLVGISNLYLLRQGADYFSLDISFNPFVHTWSLGVEEQFYLFWPLLLLACGFGRAGSDQLHQRRLVFATLLLLVASLALYFRFSLNAQADQAFYLMPSRFWQLAIGCLAYLLHRGGGTVRDLGRALPLESHRSKIATGLVAALVLLLVIPLPLLLLNGLLITVLTAMLLVFLQPGRGLAASLLGHPWIVAMGLLSYSLYLWHWPIIVLARWTLGVNRWTVLPILAATLVAALLSYRLEILFRYGKGEASWPSKPFLFFPALSLAAAGVVVALQGPFKGSLFSGRYANEALETSGNKKIDGTTISAANCFLDTTAPLPPDTWSERCRAIRHADRPTLYFEGDSHAHALMALAQQILQGGSYNVSLFGRGGCLAPYFTPWPGGRHNEEKYRLCRAHYLSRVKYLRSALKPGDHVVVVSFIHGPFDSAKSGLSYRDSVVSLARDVHANGANLIMFAPLPLFADAAIISFPLSLCRVEWFRPSWALSSACQPARVKRDREISDTSPLRDLLQTLAREVPAIKVFDPFPVVCPAGQEFCSSYSGSQRIFRDSNHLTDAGALKLYPSFRAFLAHLDVGSPHGSSPIPSSTSR